MNNKPWQKGYSLFFLTAIFTMLIGQLFVSELTLSTIPEIFLWRKGLIKAVNQFKYLMGDRVFKFAVIGSDGWMFYTGDRSIQEYQKTSPINLRSMKRLSSEIQRMENMVEQYGGTFLLVIPPDKSTTYPQYMPDEIPVIGQVSSVDRLVEYLNINTNIKVLDLRLALERASMESQVYYKTDTHWNCAGAYYAYEEILSRLAASHPELRVHPIKDFNMIFLQDDLRDIPNILGLKVKEDTIGVVPNFDTGVSIVPAASMDKTRISPHVVVNSKMDGPNLMIFHDSFYESCLSNYMETAFSRTVSLPYQDAEMSDYLDLIKAEKPNIVIVEFVERLMDYFFKNIIYE